MHTVQIVLLVLAFGFVYVPAALFVAVHGLHAYVLVGLFTRRQRDRRSEQTSRIAWYSHERPEQSWPVVTTQIPLYNEAAVAARVIESAAAIDYPADRHEIQVLDDSTDETREIVDAIVARLRDRGIDAKVIRRPTREGYKAGALAFGLAQARGEVIAVFDADFVPSRDFLHKLVPLLMDEPRNACVQGRWTHLNEDASWLTRAQAVGIDGHFVVEQSARSWNGLLMNFNGTAGVWRRAAIEDPKVGGWSADTLTEDLDLSYRAQLAGWSVEYCMDAPCPAELPPDMPALRAQQFRWAKGSFQVARKLLPRIMRSDLKTRQKIEACLHLSGYGVSVAMSLLGIIGLPLSALLDVGLPRVWSVALTIVMWIALSGPPFLHACSRRAIRSPYRLSTGFRLMLLGVGMCLHISRACWEGMTREGGEFVRTPKSGDDGTARGQMRRRYSTGGSMLWIAELAASVYSAVIFAYYLRYGASTIGAFSLIFAMGFALVGWLSSPWMAPRIAAAGIEHQPVAAAIARSDSTA